MRKTIDKIAKCNYNIFESCETQRKEVLKFMYCNLQAEQARKGMTNQQVADRLHISRVSYENKKKSGKFVVKEVVELCNLFKCDFEYLFAEIKQNETA